MNLTFRPIKARPSTWRDAGARRPSSPFRAGYDQTLRELRHELGRLDTTEAFIQVEVPAAELRQDGMLRAHAHITHPGVIVTAITKDLGTLTWPAEAFSSWQGNVRAVAKGLTHLRTLDRYGIATMGQQYAGFNELGSGTPMGSGAMSIDEAGRFLADAAGVHPPSDGTTFSGDLVRSTYRLAVQAHHPDRGGDPEMFRRLTEARDLLLGGAA